MVMETSPFADRERRPRAAARARVVLADDHRAVLETVMGLLTPEFDVVGIAADGLDAVRLVAALRPDGVVLDIAMPGLGGLAAAARIRQSGARAAVVMLTVSEDPELAAAALEGGAFAYVSKARAATDLVPALMAALEGRRFVSPPLGRPT